MQFGKIVNIVEESGLTISNFKIARLSKQEADRFCEPHKGKPQFNELTALLSSDLVLAIEVLSENAIGKVRDLANAIRSKYASDQSKPAAICS